MSGILYKKNKQELEQKNTFPKRDTVLFFAVEKKQGTTFSNSVLEIELLFHLFSHQGLNISLHLEVSEITFSKKMPCFAK